MRYSLSLWFLGKRVDREDGKHSEEQERGMVTTHVTCLRRIGRAPDTLRQELAMLGFGRVDPTGEYRLYALVQGRSVQAIAAVSLLDDEVLVVRAFVCVPSLNKDRAVEALLVAVYPRERLRCARLTYFAFVTSSVMTWRMAANFSAGLCYPHPHRPDPPRVAMVRGGLPRRLDLRGCSQGNPAKAGLPKSNGTARLTIKVLKAWWQGHAECASLVCVGTFPQSS